MLFRWASTNNSLDHPSLAQGEDDDPTSEMPRGEKQPGATLKESGNNIWYFYPSLWIPQDPALIPNMSRSSQKGMGSVGRMGPMWAGWGVGFPASESVAASHDQLGLQPLQAVIGRCMSQMAHLARCSATEPASKMYCILMGLRSFHFGDYFDLLPTPETSMKAGMTRPRCG